ncbi:MAG TPA: YceI family protein [Candidatus Saccharimonadales bacterium]|nr:YceI family protein [Candidatus Saccharimonadales bacterium]
MNPKFTSTFALLLTFGFAGQVRASDTYNIDPVHSFVSFSVQHLMINHVRGKFDKISGTLSLDNNALQQASGVIETASVDTGITPRDKDLRSTNFFDAEKYPTITFQTKTVAGTGDHLTLTGDFTMHGVTKELSLTGKFTGPIKDPWGNQRVGLEAKTTLNRQDFGMNYSKTLDTGGALVGDEVEIEINAEATKSAPK